MGFYDVKLYDLTSSEFKKPGWGMSHRESIFDFKEIDES